MTRKRRKKVTVKTKPIIISVAILVLITTFGYMFFSEDEPVDPSRDDETISQEKEEQDEKEVVEEISRCSYCGSPIDEKDENLDRPITVTLGNSSNERPQSGINAACVVYEAPAEGGLSRLFGVFNKDYEGNIGPVRSARFYFITLGLEHDSIYAHVGGYQPVINKINEHRMANIDEFGAGGAFWRSDERSAPHNTYTTLENIQKAANDRGYRSVGERSEFVDYQEEDIFDKLEGVGSTENVTVIYNSNYNRVEYKYKEDGYYRYVNGEKHIDKHDQKQVVADNLIFQFVTSEVIDDVGRLRLGLIGKGEGVYLSEGKKIPITWEKDSHRSETEFYNANTEEPLNIKPGQTWVNLIPHGTQVQYE
ncbi:DUF3048 domain-containing protein [Natranaerobius trueperi]|uniref:DUF3048 domain-containing protein n=1 Tax=Natranaerobius trueperi TaxID=759412 RepID=UPI001303301C|nr:DUF3048 domain-containing protein [Natranaerobius trueperi]